MYVSFSPVAFSNSARFFARIRAIRVKSTSKNVLTCADVCRDATMCSLISARILVIGSTVSPGHGSGSGSDPDVNRRTAADSRRRAGASAGLDEFE